MVTTIKVLKRRDGASIVVGVVVAMILWQFINMLSLPIVGKLIGEDSTFGASGGSFKDQYIDPLVAFVVQMLLLELALWIYGAAHQALMKK